MYRISDIETAILGLINEEPRYGYEIEKIIEERGMRNWTEIGFSSIYYVLKRLENNELIESRIKGMKGKPARRIYNITEMGSKVLNEKIKLTLSIYERLKSPFDLGIANIKNLSNEEILKCLNKYIESIDLRLRTLEDKLLDMKNANAPYNVIALFTRPIEHLKTEKDWTEKFAEKIRKKRL
jgi:DNA-binding PadR family transcriptional regulator